MSNSHNTKSLKILYHHRTQGRGAEGVHITSIVNSLTALGHQVTVLSPPGIDPLSNAGNAPVDKSIVKTTGVNSLWKFISKNIPNFAFELIEIFYNIPSLLRLNKELSSSSYDLIYERYAFYMISGAFMAKRFQIPLVLEANEVNGIKDRARTQSFPSLCSKFERYLFKNCTSIHTVSSYLKEMIKKQAIDEQKIEVVPNAIDPEKFSGDIDNSDLKEQLNIGESLVIGFAGWFDDWDRLDLLVDVFNTLLSRNIDLKLMLIGDGVVLETVRQMAKKYGIEDKVILTGAVPRDKIQHYLSVLDLAVITHSNEFGSPVVMFEFMGLKIPIIAPRLLPITDVLEHNQTAIIFDTLHMTSLTDHIEQLSMNPELQKKLSDNAYQLLMTKHTWLQNAQHIVDTSGIY
ncbi:MAG: glycosyltransferase family 4 protein [Gammaproteobacteria bacterium]|jgi:glycosyltransferase involved in cell wall biosynthesis|nr:glycosyltransferase family 4 protein [Gammaproteobacteria bacterium]